jgi:hypothetical protein
MPLNASQIHVLAYNVARLLILCLAERRPETLFPVTSQLGLLVALISALRYRRPERSCVQATVQAVRLRPESGARLYYYIEHYCTLTCGRAHSHRAQPTDLRVYCIRIYTQQQCSTLARTRYWHVAVTYSFNVFAIWGKLYFRFASCIMDACRVLAGVLYGMCSVCAVLSGSLTERGPRHGRAHAGTLDIERL